MENTDSTFKLALIPGLIISGVSIGISLLLWATISDMELQKNLGYITWLIIAFLYYYYTKSYRDTYLGGTISYGKAFVYMLYISLIMAFFTMLYFYILVKFLDPSMIDTMKDQAAQKLAENQDFTEAQLDKMMSMQAMFLKPWILSLSTFFASTIFGSILGLVMAIFVKNENQVIEE